MSNVKINFGSEVDTFKNVGPPPFVSISSQNVYSNEKLHTVDKVTLSGTVKKENGCTGGFQELYQKTKTLISNLNKNFDKLSILESIGSTGASGSTGAIEGGPFNIIYEWDHAIVRSISFDENKWYDWLPYTIELDCYKNGYFASDGIINPSRTVSYETQNDNIVSLSITCSCNGINNSNQAIENARSFAEINSNISIADITQASSLHANIKKTNYFKPEFPEKRILKSINETIDRLAGTVSIQKTYLLQEDAGVSNGILNFTRVLNSSENGEYTVSIDGSIQGCIDRERELGGGYLSDTTLDMIADDIKNKDWYSIANELYSNVAPIAGATGANDPLDTLLKAPISFTIDRNQNENSVQFSLEFSNKENADILIVDSTTIAKNYENSKKTIDINLQIISNLKNHAARWDSVVNYYNNFNLIDYVKAKWSKYLNTEDLEFNVTQNSYSENKFEGFINIEASFSIRLTDEFQCLQNINYTYEYTPPLREVQVGIPIKGQGCHFVENIDLLKRASFGIGGKASISKCCSYEQAIFELKNKINQISNILFSGKEKILEKIEISKQNPAGEIDFSFLWSAEQDAIIPQYIENI